jgi:hypothetical protein
MRLTSIIAVCFASFLAPGRSSADASDSPFVAKTVRPFFSAHCIGCHDANTKKGGLDLESLSGDFKNANAFEAWVKVHDRLRAGDMPPKDRKNRPAATEVEPIVKALGSGLTNAERSTRKPGDGRTVFRRLNRTEYENTLRDLLAMPGLKVKELLPEDGRANGFDKSAAGLDLSHVQLAKYLEAAEFALDAATAPHAAPPDVYKNRLYPGGGYDFGIVLTNGDAVPLKDFKYDFSMFPIVKDDQSRPKPRELQDAKKMPYPHSVGLFRHEDCAFHPRFAPFVPAYSGFYKLRLSLWSFAWNKGEVKPNARTESASLVADGRLLGYFDAPSLKPTVHELEVWLNVGEEIHFNAASLWPVRVSERKGKAAEYVGPGLAVDWLDVEGPLFEQWPPPSYRRLFGDLPLAPMPRNPPAPNDPRVPKRTPIKSIRGQVRKGPIVYGTVVSAAPEGDARRLLNDFLRRAFRRPLLREEVDRYVDLFKAELAAGCGFEVAMRTAYKAALCSPDFLFLKEPQGKLNQWALASRLSYFLWGSTPDDELMALAEKNKLAKAVLREQVERMLKDPKAERLVVDFTDQWLDLREIDATCPDRRLYPEFRPILRDAMLAETRAFFQEMLNNDLGAANIIDSDFAMLNQRLAQHYRIPGVEGAAIRKVMLRPDSHRGGILAQASVLKVTANGTVTSPVKRGAWVQKKIIGQPPSPPPPDIPAIEPDVRGTTTVREMLAKHRSIAVCATCHDKIDPPGFALESFDVIGGWQTRYRSLGEGDPAPKELTGGRGVGYKLAQKVDAAGELPNGRPFHDITGFKKLLLDDPRPLARNLANQLITYATGAPAGFADRAALEQVLDQSAASRYGLRTIIHEIVQSPMFLSK